MKAIIAAGGRGTRLQPITWTMNKHLIPLANEPMLFNALKKVAEVGIKEVAINVNPGEKDIQEVCGDGSKWGLNITYIEQEGGAVGVGQIIYSARDFVGEDDVLLYFGDNVVLGSLQKLVDRFYQDDLDACLAFVEVEDANRFGVGEFDADGNLVQIIEKPKNPPSNFAQTGLFLYRAPAYLEAFKNIVLSDRGEYEISDINTHIIKNGKAGYEAMYGWWKDTGTPAALLEGNQLLLNEMKLEEATIDESLQKSQDTRMQGKVKIGKNCKFGKNVLIRGPVIIGDNVVLEDAFIGPHTTIGSDCVVKGAEIEHSIIMQNAKILVGSRIVDSIIGFNAEVVDGKQIMPRGHKMVVGENSYLEL